MRRFKFLSEPFNTDDHDSLGFRFFGVTSLFVDDNGRDTRTMIFVSIDDGSIVLGQNIHEDHDAFHRAEEYQILGSRLVPPPNTIEVRFGVISTLTDPTP